MPRKLKTSKKKRGSYVYYDAFGNKVAEIKPGDGDGTEAYISTLHEMDDVEVDAARREDYHIPGRYDAYHGEDAENASDGRNGWLADEASDPETILINRQDAEGRESLIARLGELLESITPEQQNLIDALYRDELSGRELARRLGISEGAVRKRKNSLIKALRKKL